VDLVRAHRTLVEQQLRDLDARAELAEWTPAADGPGYEVRIRLGEAGELSKPGHLPSLMVARAGRGDPMATHAVRAVLRALIAMIDARRVLDRIAESPRPRPSRSSDPRASRG
jgi:hypothetical protein